MFNRNEINFSENLDELLSPYFYLDESLFKGEEDGDACFKKYSNEGNGVLLATRLKLEHLSQAILNDEHVVRAEEKLKYIDLLTLYSNHLDQQRFGDKPQIHEKERLVLLFLRAAFKLIPELNYENLNSHETRELSSYDQALHYFGKAERYENIPVELRLTKLENSLKIAQYLSTLTVSKEQDPHAFKNRISTRELVVNYCYQDLGRFEDAAALVEPHLATDSAFHRTQANVQLATIYTKQYLKTGENADKALQYAQDAVHESVEAGSSLLIYNARRALMEAYQALDQQDEANSIAQSILDDLANNSKCGAKPLHEEAARKILSENVPSVSLT